MINFSNFMWKGSNKKFCILRCLFTNTANVFVFRIYGFLREIRNIIACCPFSVSKFLKNPMIIRLCLIYQKDYCFIENTILTFLLALTRRVKYTNVHLIEFRAMWTLSSRTHFWVRVRDFVYLWSSVDDVRVYQ